MKVLLNGEPLPVLEQNQIPYAIVPPGEHIITGQWQWQELPDNIALDTSYGLVSLRLNGEAVANPTIDNSNRLWLNTGASEAQSSQKNSAQVRVVRLLSDSIPSMLTTTIFLDVSGEALELMMGPAVLDDFIVTELASPLPARIERDGQLRVQVKPGSWRINIISRYQGVANSLSRGTSQGLWPENEIWSFAANLAVRKVELQGVRTIDPNQANVPADWLSYPAIPVTADTQLTLATLERGMANPAANALSLRRNMWLAFNGEQYTVADAITGVINRDWRMSANVPLELGSVELSGQPQLITQLPNEQGVMSAGFEVRNSQVTINSTGILPRAPELPIGGWDANFEQVGITLHLPPAWSLLATFGVDGASAAWVQRWNLWDVFFVVLVIAVVYRLSSGGQKIMNSGLALVTLLLLYHRADAPVYSWANLVVAMAILKVVPQRAQAWVGSYFLLSLAVFVLSIIPFSAAQLSQAVYPQLENTRNLVQPARQAETIRLNTLGDSDALYEPEPEIALSQSPMLEEVVVTGAKRASGPRDRRVEAPASSKFSRYQSNNSNLGLEPDAIVQTGPAVPNWQWQRSKLSWSGPVAVDETMRSILVPPIINRLGNILAVGLTLLFLWRIIALKPLAFTQMLPLKDKLVPAEKTTASLFFAPLLLAGFFGLASMSSAPVSAQTSVVLDSELIDEWVEFLTESPECLPDCAAVSESQLTVVNDELTLELTVEAAEKVALPLPYARQGWKVNAVKLNGRNALLTRTEQLLPLVYVPKGRHTVVMQGLLPAQEVSLSFPLRLHNFQYSAQGWTVSGVVDGLVQGEQIRLNRLAARSEENQQLLPDPIDSFVFVSRTLELGLEWSLVTQVIRQAPSEGAILVDIPLLTNEAPVDANLKVEQVQSESGGAVAVAKVAMANGQSVVQWRSRLTESEQINLIASNQHQWVERWSVNASPVWHFSYSGIAPTQILSGNRYIPTWNPWPGESLTLDLQRPAAAEGRSLTLDNTSLVYSVGNRSNSSHLSFLARSSEGQNITLSLPTATELTEFTVDGQAQTLRQGSAIVVPLKPGKQTIDIKWRDSNGIGLITNTPVVDLQNPLTNIQVKAVLPSDRWILFLGGPSMGPAVLFWGYVLTLVLVSFALGKYRFSPLGMGAWFILGLGMATTSIFAPLVLVAWFALLFVRGKAQGLSDVAHNLFQVVICLATFCAALTLIAVIPSGLLATPDMQISGNGSYGSTLNWYQDQSDSQLPQAWVLSFPMWVYRLVMLAWSLWLALSLIKWVTWGWARFGRGGYFRSAPKSKPSAGKASEIPSNSSADSGEERSVPE
jgi:ABC-type amino acid transport system permease subunit